MASDIKHATQREECSRHHGRNFELVSTTAPNGMLLTKREEGGEELEFEECKKVKEVQGPSESEYDQLWQYSDLL